MGLRAWLDRQGAGAVGTLAERSGVCRKTIYNLLNGVYVPKRDTALRLSRGTGGEVTVLQILFHVSGPE